MAIAEGLADLRRIGFDKAGIRVRQAHGKEVRLSLDPCAHHQGLAEIHLRMAGIVGQRHEDLAAAQPPLAHVVLDDGIAALEAMLVAQPLVDPFGRVPLFARRRAILLENAIYDTREGIALWAPPRPAPPVAPRQPGRASCKE